jgi:hypothetical protein
MLLFFQIIVLNFNDIYILYYIGLSVFFVDNVNRFLEEI